MPKVVLENWNNEFKKWYEKMRCTMFHGNGNSKFKSLEKVQQKGGVCLTTYGIFFKKKNNLLILISILIFQQNKNK